MNDDLSDDKAMEAAIDRMMEALPKSYPSKQGCIRCGRKVKLVSFGLFGNGFCSKCTRKREYKKRHKLQASMFGGSDCYICGFKVYRGGKGMLSPTTDHIVPICKGGESNYTNLVICHRLCNSLKGTSELTQEIKNEARRRIGELRQ